MALGAQRSDVLKVVVGQGLKLSAIGIAAGIVAAFSMTRIMGSMLIGVKPNDPATFGAIAVLFFAVTSARHELGSRGSPVFKSDAANHPWLGQNPFKAIQRLLEEGQQLEDGPAGASSCCGEGPGPNAPLPGITGLGGGRVGAVVVSRWTRPGLMVQWVGYGN